MCSFIESGDIDGVRVAQNVNGTKIISKYKLSQRYTIQWYGEGVYQSRFYIVA
jgi:hypothetical protein